MCWCDNVIINMLITIMKIIQIIFIYLYINILFKIPHNTKPLDWLIRKLANCHISTPAHYIILVLLFLTTNSLAQEKFSFSGYVSTMQTGSKYSIIDQWNYESLLHNRLNLKYFANDNLSMAVELRNRMVYNKNIHASNYNTDNGLIDLSKNFVNGRSFITNCSIDRLWAAYESGKLKATIGRQRINWGQTLVWNPNDIFNTYSFFDFDYAERPGSDAIRIQYYNTEVSSTEIAIKANYLKQTTSALLYKFNAFEYDFQVLAGLLNEQDYVFGGGWSGAIKHVAFRSEISYLHSKNNFNDTTGVFIASVGFDYTFANSFNMLTEYLFNNAKGNSIASFNEFYNAPQTIKNLSIVQHNLVIQGSYPITPLISASIATMYLHGIKGYYFAPSISYSISNNFDASFYYQRFNGEFNSTTQTFDLLNLRIKWNF
jgi:hypothetical protein